MVWSLPEPRVDSGVTAVVGAGQGEAVLAAALQGGAVEAAAPRLHAPHLRGRAAAPRHAPGQGGSRLWHD